MRAAAGFPEASLRSASAKYSAKCIEIQPVQDQRVSGIVVQDTVGAEDAPEATRQYGNLLCGSSRRRVTPQTVDEPIHTDGSTVPESEDLEQGPDLASTQLSGVTPLQLEIAQNPEPHILHSTDPDTATGRRARTRLILIGRVAPRCPATRTSLSAREPGRPRR